MERKAGRPRIIPEELIPRVVQLYHEGLGYRRIAREFGKQYGIFADWSTIRRVLSLTKKNT
jgi:transposase-like protein